jgi:DNA-binding MarR family transcriptional regulator
LNRRKKLKQTNIFKLIHAIEQMNNNNIIRFTKEFQYPLGISPILVLAELRTKGPQKQVELADTIGYTKGAMTHIANKLVDLGLIEKTFDEIDRRAVQLAITPKGEYALKEAQEIGKKVFIELFEVLSEEEIENYLNIQEKLIKGIQERKEK